MCIFFIGGETGLDPELGILPDTELQTAGAPAVDPSLHPMMQCGDMISMLSKCHGLYDEIVMLSSETGPVCLRNSVHRYVEYLRDQATYKSSPVNVRIVVTILRCTRIPYSSQHVCRYWVAKLGASFNLGESG